MARASKSGWVCRLAGLAALFVATDAELSLADQGGVSFWLPGQFGSLAAVPGQPGLSVATFDYYWKGSAGGGANFQRGGPGGASIRAGLDANAEIFALNPTYTFATPVLDGRLSVGMMGLVERQSAAISATLTGPLGNTLSRSASESVTGFGDLYPQAFLKWNHGVNNFMVYAAGDIPVGTYDATSLANIGIGHGAIDGGAGYTYFDPQTGREFSVVGGLTYNFMNQATQYQNGVDGHVDWAASQFLSKQVFIGLVGYLYDQISADSGSGNRVGSFMSRVAAVGPQIGYLFPVGNMQGFLGLKSYFEFAGMNRPQGADVWLTFAISPAAAPAPTAQSPMHHK